MALPLPEAKSATLPAIDGIRLEMVRAINASGPTANYRLFTLFPSILSTSASYSNAAMKKTLETYERNRSQFLVLLCVIPAPVRNSLVLGTLAHDLYDTKPPYDASYPGVYAVGVAIKGRSGAFLNIDEIDEVVSSMHRYCQGWEAWDRHGGDVSGISMFGRTLMRHIAAVDEQYRGASGDHKPQFVGNKTIHDKAPVYIAQLTARADSTRALDLTGKVPQHQSPIYVGCSAEPIQTHMAQHHPRSGLKNSSPLLALTVSCIKHEFPHLEPETVAVPVMPTWAGQQLAVGEQLVTALASSMFYEGGLNIVQAGTHAGSDDPDTQGHVFRDNNFFADNGAATLEEHATYKQVKEDLADLQGLFDGSHQAKLAQLKASLEELRDVRVEYQAALEKEEAWYRETKQYEASLIEQQMQIRKVRRLLRAHKEKLAAKDRAKGSAVEGSVEGSVIESPDIASSP
jgi:hypothetical protein